MFHSRERWQMFCRFCVHHAVYAAGAVAEADTIEQVVQLILAHEAECPNRPQTSQMAQTAQAPPSPPEGRGNSLF
jgi:hypothetical protein